jgi:hypothetical protein
MALDACGNQYGTRWFRIVGSDQIIFYLRPGKKLPFHVQFPDALSGGNPRCRIMPGVGNRTNARFVRHEQTGETVKGPVDAATWVRIEKFVRFATK